MIKMGFEKLCQFPVPVFLILSWRVSHCFALQTFVSNRELGEDQVGCVVSF